MFSDDVLHTMEASRNLTERVAQLLREKIERGDFAVGAKLPAEGRMALQLGVSRTVVREAVSRLKSDGLLESRQGSGVFVVSQTGFAPLRVDPGTLDSVSAVVELIDLRRAIEAEAAGLAAERATPEQVQGLYTTLAALQEAFAGGGDGVEEDVRFHQQIAAATGNRHYVEVLGFLEQRIRKVTRITRANEARRASFAQQVQIEHEAIVRAIGAGDAAAARRAGHTHMVNAAKRIRQADEAFWKNEGGRYVNELHSEPG